MTGRTDAPRYFEARCAAAAANVDHALPLAWRERVERFQPDCPDLHVEALVQGRPGVARPSIPVSNLIGIGRCRYALIQVAAPFDQGDGNSASVLPVNQ